MKILIIGASGKTGQQLLAHLSKTKHAVSGLIRKPEQEVLIKQFGAKPLLGDLEGDVENIAKGFDAIMFVAGSRGKNVQGVDYQGAVKVIDSAITHKIKRFLYISSINIDKKPEQFIAEMKQYYQQHNEPIPGGLLATAEKPGYKTYLELKKLIESKLIESGLNYTILRAGLLTKGAGSGRINVTPGSLNAFGKISHDNVVRSFIEALENKSCFRKIVTILDGETLIEAAFTIE